MSSLLRTTTLTLVVALSALGAACSSGSDPVDVGLARPDAGLVQPDATTTDAVVADVAQPDADGQPIDGGATDAAAGDAEPSDTGATDAGGETCSMSPMTHLEIINACTDAEFVEKAVSLPLLNPDGTLPPLP